ncbi:MAG: efflux RND transporter permease subunit, partial [Bacteroidales bacterium]|nr:efflux RND transporter permease subunit [Bacteroidales bacterium]
SLTVPAPNGMQIPFEQIADIAIKSGPAQVSRENTKRRITIGFNVRNRDVKSVIGEVSQKIDTKIEMPTGYYVSYGGQFQNLEAAQKRLSIAVPIALLMIFILLYFTFHSVSQSLLIFTAVPMSAIGGIFALWIRGMNFSISAGVGFIALFGVAVLNGIVLIAEFNRLEKEGFTDIRERVIKGLHTRLRPVIVTAAVASLGFLPMALSTSAGAEVQKPLATVVIGGLITATLLTLVVLPIFYIFFTSGKKRKSLVVGSVEKVAIVAILLGSASLLTHVQAQQVKEITLPEAIQTALRNNLAIKSASYSVDRQKALKGAAVDIPKTAIDGQYGQFNSYTNDNSFSVSQTIAFPTVYIHQGQLARESIKSSELQLKVSQLEIATQVKQAYWQYLYLIGKQHLLAYQDSIYTRFLTAAELRAKSGETNKLEMITARSQSLEIRNQLLQIHSDISICSRKLMLLVNSDLPLMPVETDLQRKEIQLIEDSSAIRENPSLAYMMQQIEIAGKEKNIAQSQLLPDISLGYFNQSIIGTQEVNGVPREFDQGYRFTGVQAGIAIPIWAKPFAAKIKAAKISETMARNEAAYYQRSLAGDYQSLLDEYRKNLTSVEYYDNQAVPEADVIIEQANLSYKAGALDYLDYVLTLDRALKIRQNALDAVNNYNQTVISIEYLMGKVF